MTPAQERAALIERLEVEMQRPVPEWHPPEVVSEPVDATEIKAATPPQRTRRSRKLALGRVSAAPKITPRVVQPPLMRAVSAPKPPSERTHFDPETARVRAAEAL